MVRKSCPCSIESNGAVKATTNVHTKVTESNAFSVVKFETEKLPEILNALETDNGGNKLILEVSVRANTTRQRATAIDSSF
jgi:F-type H+/Na+-transporting ATPase subunit beta